MGKSRLTNGIILVNDHCQNCGKEFIVIERISLPVGLDTD
jgi:hypothetical protein